MPLQRGGDRSVRGIRVHPEADRVLLVGQTRKGKTTLAEFIAAQLQPVRLIIVDPKEEFLDGHWGCQAARSPAQLAGAMHQPVVHYIPGTLDPGELEEAAEIIWVTPGPYILWLDETAALSNANWCPKGFKLCVTQGGKQCKLVLALTQRLAESHPVFRSQADHVFVMVPPPIELDLKAIAAATRREPEVIREGLQQLQDEYGDYSHLWYCLDGDELRLCAPVPLEEAPGRQPPDPGGGQPADGEEQPDVGRRPATQPDLGEGESGPCERSASP